MRQLRINFILVAMCSMLVVLLFMIGGLNVLNYRQITKDGDRLTKMIMDNNGTFPDNQNNDKKPPDDGGKAPDDQPMDPGLDQPGKNQPRKDQPGTREEQYQTRYFIVEKNGDQTTVNVDHIAAVDESVAKQYAGRISGEDGATGYLDIYRYCVVVSGEKTTYVFVDCEKSLNTFWGTLRTSAGMSAIGYGIVLLLVCVLSRVVFKPVKESYDKQKQFITDASHELKTPLTIIEANTEVMEMDVGENEWSISTHRQIDRMSHLVQQMVSLTRMDEGKKRLEKKKFSLSEALYDQLELYASQAIHAGIMIKAEVDPDVEYVGNEEELRKLFGILFDNAMKYATPSTEFEVSLHRKKHRIEMVFTNQTNEVEKGDQNILFERFYRSDASRNSQTGGSGIGLSIAKVICENHGGRIYAESLDGKSLTITLILRK